MIKDNGHYFQLDVVVEKFKRKLVPVKSGGKILKDDQGKTIKEEVEIFVKDILVPTNFYKDAISIYGITLDDNYRLRKDKTTIYDKYSNKLYLVNHSVKELETVKNKRNPIGFQLGLNRK